MNIKFKFSITPIFESSSILSEDKYSKKFGILFIFSISSINSPFEDFLNIVRSGSSFIFFIFSIKKYLK